MHPPDESEVVVLDTCRVDLVRRRYEGPDRQGALTTTEAKLLGFLVARPGKDVSREELLERVWEYAASVSSRAVDTAVRRLRSKLEREPGEPAHILTVTGLGYRFVPIKSAGRTTDASVSVVSSDTEDERDRFFGREAQMQFFRDKVAEGTGLITLIGPGGVGKTRLARRFLVSVADQRATAFVDLTEALHVHDLLRAVGLVLGIGADTERISAVLRTRKLVLVLDNFEQIVDCADEVALWVRKADGACILVTSRTRLGVEGETVVELPPLSAPDGLSLLVNRARQVQSAWGADTDPALLASIVDQLDGLPLALELAAARARVLAPRELLDRLDERFRILRRRGSAARHATLAATLAWSWELLEPHERTALTQCTVFHGGWSLEAAEAVVQLDGSDAPMVMDVVEALVDHSWIQTRTVSGRVRFSMFESARAYARDQLTADAQQAAQARHRGFYAQLCGGDLRRTALPPLSDTARSERIRERDNLAHCIETGVTAGDGDAVARAWLAWWSVARDQGDLATAERLLPGVSSIEGVSDLLEVLVRVSVCEAHGFAGRLSQAHEGLAALRSGIEQREDDDGWSPVRAWIFRVSGDVSHQSNDTELEAAMYEAARDVYQKLGDAQGEGVVWGKLGVLHRDHGRVEQAHACFEAALEIHRASGNRRQEGIVLGNQGQLFFNEGRLTQARVSLESALERHQALENRRWEALTMAELAVIHRSQGRLESACAGYRTAIEILRDLGYRRYAGTYLGNLGNTLADMGNADAALMQYREALAIHQAVGNRRDAGVVLGNMGDLAWSQGDAATAAHHLETAVEICDVEWPFAAGAARGSLAVIRAGDGDFAEARALLERADEQVRGHRPVELCKLLCRRGEVELMAGDRDAARDALAEAKSLADDLGATEESALRSAIAQLTVALGD